eukprot:795634-Pleurochrysis_carterae.AAC.1
MSTRCSQCTGADAGPPAKGRLGGHGLYSSPWSLWNIVRRGPQEAAFQYYSRGLQQGRRVSVVCGLSDSGDLP